MSGKYSREEIERARAVLLEAVRPGDTVYTILRHVSGSGMSRWISVIVTGKDGQPHDYSWQVARVVGSPVNTRNHEGVERGGCGMDMGFDLVYSLSRALFKDSFRCIQPRKITADTPMRRARQCPSNDHVNARNWDRMPGLHSDAGYALSQRWL